MSSNNDHDHDHDHSTTIENSQNLSEFKFSEGVPKYYHDLLGPMFTPFADLLAKCMRMELDLENHAYDQPLHVLVIIIITELLCVA